MHRRCEKQWMSFSHPVNEKGMPSKPCIVKVLKNCLTLWSNCEGEMAYCYGLNARVIKGYPVVVTFWYILRQFEEKPVFLTHAIIPQPVHYASSLYLTIIFPTDLFL